MNPARCLHPVLVALLCLLGCASPPAESNYVYVAGYEMTDTTSDALIFRTLRRQGIECLGVSNAGWISVSVPKRQFALAHALLSELNPEGHTFRLIDR